MRIILITLALSVFAFTTVIAQTAILQGGIVTNRLLNRDTCYLLRGCVSVQPGAILTIPAGTRIMGEKSTNGTLAILPGAKIIANGISSNPIVFTSNQTSGSRNPGDWGGIVIGGRATNNQPGGTFVVDGPCGGLIAGGTDDADNSGIMRFVQIHYAGISTIANPEGAASLTLACVGNQTIIENIQVTYANDDAFEWFGGTVNCKNLISYNTFDDDFDTNFGYRGNVQFGFAYRRDPSSHSASGSNGFESDNDLNGSLNTPQTRPTFSNITILGPLYANVTAHADYKRGVHIRRNSAQRTYNSVISGWPLEGLFLDGTPSINNTNSVLNFSGNSFFNNNGTAIGYGHTPASWTGCSATMADWMNFPNAAGPACLEKNNIDLTVAPGYSNTLKTFVCPARPSLILSTNNLGAPDYASADLADAFFIKTGTFRGAFGLTDWTLNWTNWCPQSTVYCSAGFAEAKVAAGQLQLVPNPGNGTTYAVFTAPKAGQVRLTVMDKVTGQPVRTVTTEVTAGEQRISFEASGLTTGVYIVRLEMENGFVASARFSVN
jgi:hypothetical protein